MSTLWADPLENDIPGLTGAGIESFFSCSSTSTASSQTRLAAALDSSSIGSSRDSVAERRRHAIYFHRPPVWWSSTDPSSHLAASDLCETCLLSVQGTCDNCESRISYGRPGRQSSSFSSLIDQEHRLCQEVEAANAGLLAGFDSSTSESDQGLPLLVSLSILEGNHGTLTTCKG